MRRADGAPRGAAARATAAARSGAPARSSRVERPAVRSPTGKQPAAEERSPTGNPPAAGDRTASGDRAAIRSHGVERPVPRGRPPIAERPRPEGPSPGAERAAGPCPLSGADRRGLAGRSADQRRTPHWMEHVGRPDETAVASGASLSCGRDQAAGGRRIRAGAGQEPWSRSSRPWGCTEACAAQATGHCPRQEGRAGPVPVAVARPAPGTRPCHGPHRTRRTHGQRVPHRTRQNRA